MIKKIILKNIAYPLIVLMSLFIPDLIILVEIYCLPAQQTALYLFAEEWER